MTAMLEKAARALHATVSPTGRWESLSESAKKRYAGLVRAVLLAVREPDGDTGDAGYGDWDWGPPGYDSGAGSGCPVVSFTAMIDAILNDGATNGQA